MKLKKYISSLLLGIILVNFIGCEETGINSNSNYDISNNESIVQKNDYSEEKIIKSLNDLNNAKKITITKDLISLNNSYSVHIDGNYFGSITGKYINLTGDKFTLKDEESNKLSSEKQIKRWNIKLNRLAEVYNYKDDIVGYIGEEIIKDMFKFGYVFHFYDKDKNEIGISKQKVFSFLDTFNIYDTNNNLCYEINSEFTLVSDKYTITVHDNSNIPIDQVVYLTAILNSIKRSNSEKE